MLDKNRTRLIDKDEVVHNQIVQINETDICDNVVFNNMAVNTLYYLGGYIICAIKN